jgi:hypothetical protein
VRVIRRQIGWMRRRRRVGKGREAACVRGEGYGERRVEHHLKISIMYSVFTYFLTFYERRV